MPAFFLTITYASLRAMTSSTSGISWPGTIAKSAGWSRSASYSPGFIEICSAHVPWPHSQTNMSSSVSVANVSLTSRIRSFASRKTASFSPIRRSRSSIGATPRKQPGQGLQLRLSRRMPAAPPAGRCRPRRTAAVPSAGSSIPLVVSGPSVSIWIPKHGNRRAVNSQPETGKPNGLHPELEHEDGRGHLRRERGIFIVVGARRCPGSGAPTFQRGAAAALDPSERGPSSSPPHSWFPLVVSAALGARAAAAPGPALFRFAHPRFQGIDAGTCRRLPNDEERGHDRDHARAPCSRRRPEGAVDDGAGDAEGAGDRRRSPPTDGSEGTGASHPGGGGNPPPA